MKPSRAQAGQYYENSLNVSSGKSLRAERPDRNSGDASRSVLTERQQEVLAAIRRYILAHGFAPGLRDLMEPLGISLNGVRDHVRALAKKGAIDVSYRTPRGIRLIGDGCPFCGRAA